MQPAKKSAFHFIHLFIFSVKGERVLLLAREFQEDLDI